MTFKDVFIDFNEKFWLFGYFGLCSTCLFKWLTLEKPLFFFFFKSQKIFYHIN